MKNLVYVKPKSKVQVDPHWTKYLLLTHPVQFITTIGRVRGKLETNVAPFATCLDTSYNPSYVTIAAFIHQHTPAGKEPIKGKMNTYLNIKQNGLFIINTPNRALLTKLDVLAYPYKRGYAEDKIKKAELTKANPFVFPEHHLYYPPIIQECLAHIECETIDIHRPRGSDHYLITGRVIGASYDQNLGKSIEEIRKNLVRQVFHHYGPCGKNKRNIAYLVPKKVRTLTLQLEHSGKRK